VQSFTAHMPLLTATSAFELGRRCWSSPQQCYLHCLRTINDNKDISASAFDTVLCKLCHSWSREVQGYRLPPVITVVICKIFTNPMRKF